MKRNAPESEGQPGTGPTSTSAAGPGDDTAECLSEDEILRHIEGGTGSARNPRLEEHLDRCESCRVMVAEAARALQLPGTPEVTAASGAGRPLTLSAGEVLLERYTIVRFVARGGMGEVYEARDATLNETVALKTVVSTALDDPKAMQSFLAEVRLARQVTHPNVCRIHEIGFCRRGRSPSGETVPFLTMEFLRGETLDARISRAGRLSPEYVAHLLPQITAGLRAIHAAGIVHRDIKPHNISLEPGPPERLVLMDFGLARAMEQKRDGQSSTGPLVVGTVDYMSPEQLEGKPPTSAFDVYALGVVIYQMLTGRKPFAGPTQLSSALERYKRAPPKPSTLVKELPPGWDALVTRCLALAPEDRYARVEDIVPPTATATALPPPPARRRAGLGALLGVLALAALGVALWRTTDRPAPTPPSASAPQTSRPATRRPWKQVQRSFGANGCSADMVRVTDGVSAFCIDRYEASLVDDVEERPLSPHYSPTPSRLRSFQRDWEERLARGSAGAKMPLPSTPDWQTVDGWGPRAVSRADVLPQGHVNLDEARDACASGGKRLCTEHEWDTACRGEKRTTFPYGNTYHRGECNTGREDHPVQILHGSFETGGLMDPRLNLVVGRDGPMLRKTGVTKECVSIWGGDGVYDMVGNLYEWIDDPEGTLAGGYYVPALGDTPLPGVQSCGHRVTRHSGTYASYASGFRCCDDVR